MTTSIVIAYRDMGDPYRRASFDWVHRYWSATCGDIVVEPGEGSFSRAQAINTGVRRSLGDIIVQSDPDSVVPWDQVQKAIHLATVSSGLVIAHDRYLYLTREATAAWLTDPPPDRAFGPADCDEYGQKGVGNVVVFSRETWDHAGGFDERFGMYGGDDAAFAYACDAIVAPLRRVPGDLVHLWHPRLPQSVPGNPGYAEHFAILAEYRDAAAVGPEAVRELVGTR